MKIRFLTLLTTLAFLGLCVSVPAFAGKIKNCDPPDPHPSCKDDGVSTMYTAELVDGAFIFNLNDEVTRDRIVIPNSRETDLIGSEVAQMSRPTNSVDQATWDDLFSTGCPQLEMGGDGWVPSFLSTDPNWTWEKFGARRLVLRNIHLVDIDDVEWEIRVQLIGKSGDLSVDPFLPTEAVPVPRTRLIRGRLEGRTVSAAPGERKSCKTDSGTKDKLCEGLSDSDKMEGFCLNNGASVYMEIANLP